MKYLLKHTEFIIEKSIGSENIRNKHYSDLPKDIFYRIVNLDPTSIRKKDFSKPGKYVKWLIIQYKKNNYFKNKIDDNDNEYIFRLNKYLFIFSTQWYKNKSNKSIYIIGGKEFRHINNDIMKYNDILNFIKDISNIESEYETTTEDALYEEVFKDEKISILIPMNFTASREIAKHTDWCTQSYTGYSIWNSRSILFRIIPNNEKYEKVKITWEYKRSWSIASQKYPEITGHFSSPFDVSDDGTEKWLEILNEYKLKYKNKYNSVYNKIEETMNLLSNDAKEKILGYYNKNKS